jgi:DNA mismatch repair ATPase MutS
VALVAADLSTGETRHAVLADAAALGEWLGAARAARAADRGGRRGVGGGARDRAAGGDADAAGRRRASTAAVGAAWLRAHAAEAPPRVAVALGALLGYLASTHRASVDHLRAPERDAAQAVLHIDEGEPRNLELLSTTRGERRGSLLSVLDETHTPMGGRLLRQWLLAPLTDVAAIGTRLDAVEAFVREPSRRERVATLLGGIGDLDG